MDDALRLVVPFPLKLNTSKPTPASVAKMAFFPGMTVIENGRRPPDAGVDLTGSADREPSAAISQVARKPIFLVSQYIDSNFF